MATNRQRKYSVYFKDEQQAKDLQALAAFYEVSCTDIVHEALAAFMNSRQDDLERARKQAAERSEYKQAREASPIATPF